MALTLQETWAGAAETGSALGAPSRPTLTFGALRSLIAHTLADLNALGLGRNDRVAIVLDNGPEMAGRSPAGQPAGRASGRAQTSRRGYARKHEQASPRRNGARERGACVHGPTSWACAIRTSSDEIKITQRPQTAAGGKGFSNPSCAGRSVSRSRSRCFPSCAASSPRRACPFERPGGAGGDARERADRAGRCAAPTGSAMQPASSLAGAPVAGSGHARPAWRRACRLPRRRARLDRNVRAR